MLNVQLEPVLWDGRGAFLRCLITDPPEYRRVGARPSRTPLTENKLLTWNQAIVQVTERGSDYLAWYENTPREAGGEPAEFPQALAGSPKEKLRLLGEALLLAPDTALEMDVVKRVYHLNDRSWRLRNEHLETRRVFEGYCSWYGLGATAAGDTENALEVQALLEQVYNAEDIGQFETRIGKGNVSGRVHCLKVLLFLAIHPQKTLKRKEMPLILWDPRGKKPLSSFETHRKILARLMGQGKTDAPLKKGSFYENDRLVLEQVQNEWCIRLKTGPQNKSTN